GPRRAGARRRRRVRPGRALHVPAHARARRSAASRPGAGVELLRDASADTGTGGHDGTGGGTADASRLRTDRRLASQLPRACRRPPRRTDPTEAERAFETDAKSGPLPNTEKLAIAELPAIHAATVIDSRRGPLALDLTC